MIPSFSGGTFISNTLIDVADSVAYLKPQSLMASATLTVSSIPYSSNIEDNTLPRSFFFNVLLINLNFSGMIELNITLPTIVWIYSHLYARVILSFKTTRDDSYALITSSIDSNIPAFLGV